MKKVTITITDRDFETMTATIESASPVGFPTVSVVALDAVDGKRYVPTLKRSFAMFTKRGNAVVAREMAKLVAQEPSTSLTVERAEAFGRKLRAVVTELSSKKGTREILDTAVRDELYDFVSDRFGPMTAQDIFDVY